MATISAAAASAAGGHDRVGCCIAGALGRAAIIEFDAERERSIWAMRERAIV
jgi:hypothetical protein